MDDRYRHPPITSRAPVDYDYPDVERRSHRWLPAGEDFMAIPTSS